MALIGEFDSVAKKVYKYLVQAMGVADQPVGDGRVYAGEEFERWLLQPVLEDGGSIVQDVGNCCKVIRSMLSMTLISWKSRGCRPTITKVVNETFDYLSKFMLFGAGRVLRGDGVPLMPFIGRRISWLILARNCSCIRLAWARMASSNWSWTFFRRLKSVLIFIGMKTKKGNRRSYPPGPATLFYDYGFVDLHAFEEYSPFGGRHVDEKDLEMLSAVAGGEFKSGGGGGYASSAGGDGGKAIFGLDFVVVRPASRSKFQVLVVLPACQAAEACRGLLQLLVEGPDLADGRRVTAFQKAIGGSA